MRNMLIAGATSGIAKATARQLASEGVDLILAGRDMTELEAMASDLRIRYGVQIRCLRFDALEYDSHESFFQACVSEFGTLDGLLLAFGSLDDQREAERDWSRCMRMLESNYIGAVSLLNAAANWFEEKGTGGVISVITSVAGDRGRQSNYIYGSAKGALSIYLQGLRNRLHKAGVDVVTIKPGFVDTRMTYGKLGASPLVISPERAARIICRGIRKRRPVVYVPFFWSLIMRVIRTIPERLFKRMNL